MSKQITIRMPKKMLAKWLKALRSGEYKQTQSRLYDEKTAGFCCLGVLQHCIDGGVEFDDDGPRDFPSLEWLEDVGIRFTSRFGDAGADPNLPSLDCSASEANDTGKRFKTIAKAIEAHAEGY